MLSDLREIRGRNRADVRLCHVHLPPLGLRPGRARAGCENDAEILIASSATGPTDSVNCYFYKEYLLSPGRESRQPEIQTISPTPY